jgi:hypothetical protein
MYNVSQYKNAKVGEDTLFNQQIALYKLKNILYKLLFKSCRFAPQRLRKTKSQQSTCRLFYISLLVYIGTSPNLSSMTCSSTSMIGYNCNPFFFFSGIIFMCHRKTVEYYMLWIQFRLGPV